MASPSRPLPPDPNASPPDQPGSEDAVEWSASVDGTVYGPTVATIFGQWVRSGRVTPDTLVWRTGWDDWRRAGDVASELPAPFPGTAAPPPPPPPAPAPTPSAELAAAPAPAATPTPTAAARLYAKRRTAEARRNRLLAIALALVCLGLVAMLVWLLLSEPTTPDTAQRFPERSPCLVFSSRSIG